MCSLMRAGDTWTWAVSEWGVFRQDLRLSREEKLRWLRQWVPFGARTAAWGSFSVTAGALTGGRASTYAARRWSRGAAASLNIGIDIVGRIPEDEERLLFVSNHESLIDILILGAVLPGDFRWAAKRSLMKVPFLGWHLRLAGHIPVDRKKGAAAAAAVVDAFTEVLRTQASLLVFPEGTRSSDGRLRPFKKGAFIAAVRAGRPVVPVAISGTHELMSRDDVDSGDLSRVADRRVTVQFAEPLTANPTLSESDAIDDLRDRAHAAIAAMREHPIAEAK